MTRRNRQVGVILSGLGYLALVYRAASLAGQGRIILPVAGALLTAGLYLAWQGSRQLILRPDHLLDERQRSVRDRSYRLAYWVFAVLVVVQLLFYPTLTRGLGADPATRAFGFGAGILLLAAMLPLLVLAWVEPDPPEDSGTHVPHGRAGSRAGGARSPF